MFYHTRSVKRNFRKDYVNNTLIFCYKLDYGEFLYNKYFALLYWKKTQTIKFLYFVLKFIYNNYCRIN